MLVGLAFLTFAYPEQMRGEGVWVPVDGVAVPAALNVAAVGGLGALEASGVTWTEAFLGRTPGSWGETSALACVLGGAWLVLRRAASWRILAGVLVGTVATATLLSFTSGDVLPSATLPWRWHLCVGSLAFGAVFLATDPVTSAETQLGRWVYGALIGFLAVVIRVASPVHVEGTMLAILLGNVFAPLIDHGVVRLHVRRRLGRSASIGGVP